MISRFSARSVRTTRSVYEPPVATLELNLVQNIKIENASIAVDNVVMPESVEQALWKYFVAKYGRVIDVTALNSSAQDWRARERRQCACDSCVTNDQAAARAQLEAYFVAANRGPKAWKTCSELDPRSTKQAKRLQFRRSRKRASKHDKPCR